MSSSLPTNSNVNRRGPQAGFVLYSQRIVTWIIPALITVAGSVLSSSKIFLMTILVIKIKVPHLDILSAQWTLTKGLAYSVCVAGQETMVNKAQFPSLPYGRQW